MKNKKEKFLEKKVQLVGIDRVVAIAEVLHSRLSDN